MTDRQDLKNWLIKKKGYSIMKAEEIIYELELPFPPEEEHKELLEEYILLKKLEKSESITFRIPTHLKKALQTIAKENNMKLSLVIRNAIQCFIDDYYNFERRLENEKRSREKIDRQRSIQKNSSKH